MDQLRDPETGCPWDREQDFSTIAPYTIEEAYEVADAIQRGRMDELKDELGDLLFQVVFHSRMASEIGAFGFDDVVEAVCDVSWYLGFPGFFRDFWVVSVCLGTDHTCVWLGVLNDVVLSSLVCSCVCCMYVGMLEVWLPRRSGRESSFIGTGSQIVAVRKTQANPVMTGRQFQRKACWA